MKKINSPEIRMVPDSSRNNTHMESMIRATNKKARPRKDLADIRINVPGNGAMRRTGLTKMDRHFGTKPENRSAVL
jgi:hypothetical protein